MAISYPLDFPTALPLETRLRLTPYSKVYRSPSVFTHQTQTYRHQGQWWDLQVETRILDRREASELIAFLLALNGQEGVFYFGDPLCRLPLGGIKGSVQVGAGAVKGDTTLPIQGGSGWFALSDYLQIGNELYRVTNLSKPSRDVDVFPRLRSAYAQGTAITYVDARGIFQMTSSVVIESSRELLYEPIIFEATEFLT